MFYGQPKDTPSAWNLSWGRSFPSAKPFLVDCWEAMAELQTREYGAALKAMRTSSMMHNLRQRRALYSRYRVTRESSRLEELPKISREYSLGESMA